MYELKESELYEIDGGGIVSGIGGAIIGGLVGHFVGTAGCITTYFVCVSNGENKHDAGKAAMTVYGASVVTGASIGFCAGLAVPFV